MRRILVGAALAVALGWGALAPAALAEEPASPPRFVVERTADGRPLYRALDGVVVPGTVHRPQAFVLLERAAVEYRAPELERDFLPRILAATGRHPF